MRRPRTPIADAMRRRAIIVDSLVALALIAATLTVVIQL